MGEELVMVFAYRKEGVWLVRLTRVHYTVCAVLLFIFSTGGKFSLVSIVTCFSSSYHLYVLVLTTVTMNYIT